MVKPNAKGNGGVIGFAPPSTITRLGIFKMSEYSDYFYYMDDLGRFSKK